MYINKSLNHPSEKEIKRRHEQKICLRDSNIKAKT